MKGEIAKLRWPGGNLALGVQALASFRLAPLEKGEIATSPRVRAAQPSATVSFGRDDPIKPSEPTEPALSMTTTFSTDDDGQFPWLRGPSLLDAIRRWDGGFDFTLPDEPPPAPNQLRFSSGALEGISLHWSDNTPLDEQGEARAVCAVIEVLGRSVREGSDEARAALYRLLEREPTVPYSDTLVEEITRADEMTRDDLQSHARWLVRVAAHRGPLKFGILLLGLSGTDQDVAELLTMARHDEFTLYAAVAAGNLLDDPTDVWWEMARNVHGWGKVHVVERLCRRVEYRADVHEWLLRHGCDNRIMPEYLAFCCATAGGLAAALAEDEVDDDLLNGAGVIVGALLRGGPAEDVEQYANGVEALRHLLRHLRTRCTSLSRLNVVASVHDWLEWPEPRPTPEHLKHFFDEAPATPPESTEETTWQRRSRLGWTPAVREELTGACAAILGQPHWPERVRGGFRSGDRAQEFLAWGLAQRLGVDLWEEAFARLQANPLDGALYCSLVRTNDLERVRRVIELAEATLPLDRVATGPGDLIGVGPGFEPHGCLDYVLQEMRREGVFSGRLIAAALRSPVVRNRNMALAALEKQPVPLWNARVREALRLLVTDEPRDDVRQRVQVQAARMSSP
jgi:hypothetical protein